MNHKFEIGQLVATAAIYERMKSDERFAVFVKTSFGKYIQGDWGDTCEEDKQTNEDSLRDGERLLAVYIYPETGEKIWIITEWDRSVTTILFPEDY